MAPEPRIVIGGIDTHKEIHVAAVLDTNGAILGTEQFATTRQGYRRVLAWMRSFGDVRCVGIEGTGSYGAGITRHLSAAGVQVLEVDRPDRSDRRLRGKSDTLDAEAAARAAWAGRRTSVPKTKTGRVESLRVLRLTRSTAVKARRAAMQLLRNHIVSAPDPVRDELRRLTRMQLIRVCASWRPDNSAFRDPVVATRIALKMLARRIIELGDEIATLDDLIEPLVGELNPRLASALGVGTEIAGQLLVTAGDNPERMRSEAGFAMLCGVAPLPASSGMTNRHRLNRGGDRAANCALHMAVICRMRLDQRTKTYVAKRTADGLSKREIIRCLKRYVARELYALLRPALAHSGA
ncbi:MAG: IS110 family transposase [Chloroflexi bacterium]|nr:IS110 family transposase [Chloroflexota bacterium]